MNVVEIIKNAAAIESAEAAKLTTIEVLDALEGAKDQPYKFHPILGVKHKAMMEAKASIIPFTTPADQDQPEWWRSDESGRYDLIPNKGIRFIPA